jgi:hypothetical protein
MSRLLLNIEKRSLLRLMLSSDGLASKVQIPVHRGQSFRRIADSIPVIADSF